MEVNICHCFFEQSGTFKNEFKKLGIASYDYDIQNKFGMTDYVVDLFHEIECGYKGKKSIFDKITHNDIIIAFFPCTYFETVQMLYYCGQHHNLKGKSEKEKTNIIIDRIHRREKFLILLYQLIAVCKIKGLRLIIENPATRPGYILFEENFYRYTFVDNDRTMRGDIYKKPTAYWFINCKPTNKRSFQPSRVRRTIISAKKGDVPGICSTERSLITADYARNFICDFILGKETKYTIKEIFNYD